jgi:small neutral amino acid transporter SnatA (MarC family)
MDKDTILKIIVVILVFFDPLGNLTTFMVLPNKSINPFKRNTEDELRLQRMNKRIKEAT